MSQDGLPLDVLTVGRKTPGDGKLEIPASTAALLETLGSRDLAVRLRAGDAAMARDARATLTIMPCTCAREPGQAHRHHFLESPAFRDLAAGASVELRLADDGGLELRLPGEQSAATT